MEFIPLRQVRNEPGKIRETIEQDGQAVLTSGGKPFALALKIDPGRLEETLLLLSQLRAAQAASSMRAQARGLGLDRLAAADIDAEIRAARAGR